MHHFLPKLVELHNYVSSNSAPQKKANWELLGSKVPPPPARSCACVRVPVLLWVSVCLCYVRCVLCGWPFVRVVCAAVCLCVRALPENCGLPRGRHRRWALTSCAPRQVFKRLRFKLTKDAIEGIVGARPMHIERLLQVRPPPPARQHD